MILAEEAAPGMRFRMLETLREFAEDQVAPEERALLARRHAEHFLALAEDAERHYETVDERARLDDLKIEVDNFRAALAWGLERDPESALRLAGALGPFWSRCGYYADGREALVQALERAPHAKAEWRGKALSWAGGLAGAQGEFPDAQRLLEEKLALSRAVADRAGIAEALMRLGEVRRGQGDRGTARLLFEESLSIGQELGDKRQIAEVLPNLLTVGAVNGPAHARALLQESLEIYRQLGDRRGTAGVLNHLGIHYYWYSTQETA